MNPRMNPPRGQNMSPMGSYSPGMRGPPPNSNMGPGSSGPNMPLPMGGMSGRPQWQPNPNTVSTFFSIKIHNNYLLFCYKKCQYFKFILYLASLMLINKV